MSTLQVSVKGVTGIRRALRPLLDPEITKHADAAAKEAAKVYAKALRPEARAVSRRMGRAVRVRRAKRDRPAWVVGSSRRVAFFWPFVIGGTRDHGPRKAKALVWSGRNGVVVAHRVSGVKANPIVERVAKRSEDSANRAAEAKFAQETGL